MERLNEDAKLKKMSVRMTFPTERKVPWSRFVQAWSSAPWQHLHITSHLLFLRVKTHTWTLLSFSVTWFVMAACAPEVSFVRESPSDGIIAYSFKDESDILTSQARGEAFRLIGDKCANGYRLIHEGEIARIAPQVDKAWRGQLGIDRLWGLQFECH